MMTTKRNNRLWMMVVCALAMLMLCACGRKYVPRPYGYYRIELPDTAYRSFSNDTLPYAFPLSVNAVVSPQHESNERNWINIDYPDLNATIHCSYKPVKGNLAVLSDEAQQFVYKHAMKAEAIPERGFENPSKRVYGVYYELQGNTASPIQFVLTDSTQHFFRAALYFNTHPNQDSIAPVLEYMQTDIIRLVESFEWR